MPDQIFANPRLAEIYDAFDGARDDLDPYLAIAKELQARTVLDIGSGTGCFASLLASEGFEVTGLEPAQALLDVARHKPHADKVRWILGDATNLPPLAVDLAVMTGNVAQVFLTDEAWKENVSAVHRSLRRGGHLVFEARDPAQQAWLKWTRENTYSRLDIPGRGFVASWTEVTSVSEPFVSFRHTYIFEVSGETITSDSTLRFRGKEEILRSLEKTGYAVCDIRDAPDRPGLEFVFITTTI